MTSQTLIFKTTYLSSSFAKEFAAKCKKWVMHYLPRPRMMISGGLFITGLCVPFLMGLALIPASLFLGFLGMVFTCTGLVLTLYYL